MVGLNRIFENCENSLLSKLKAIRMNLPNILGFEDVAILIDQKKFIKNPGYVNSDEYSIYGLSPGISCVDLNLQQSAVGIDLYHSKLKNNCISHKVFDDCDILHVQNPRSHPSFIESVDNLTPVSFFCMNKKQIISVQNIVYCALSPDKEHNIGIVQLVNKQKGFLTERDKVSYFFKC